MRVGKVQEAEVIALSSHLAEMASGMGLESWCSSFPYQLAL